MSRLPLLTVVLIAACGVDSVKSGDDPYGGWNDKGTETLWLALTQPQPPPFVVALSTVTSGEAAWRLEKAQLLAAAPADVAVEIDWEHLPLLQLRANTREAALAVLDRDEVIAGYAVESCGGGSSADVVTAIDAAIASPRADALRRTAAATARCGNAAIEVALAAARRAGLSP